jgi:glycosyltransferase involved in cell wall biosynthesis
MSLVHKAVSVYQNQGLKGVADKGMRFTRKRLHKAAKRLSAHRESADEKALRKEFEFVRNDIFQITTKNIVASRKATASPAAKDIKTATWFVPYFNHFAFGGIQTIFRFIEKLSKEGVHNRIVIYDNPAFDVKKMREEVKYYFPDLKDYEVIVFPENKLRALEKLPPSDIAFCTIWVSAYLLLRYNQTKRKYYFIQDYEPLFYVAGSTYALAASTYRFGFRGVVNTPGLLAAVNQQHGLEGISFIPSVNTAVFYPDPNRNNKKVRIFFYARPLNPRNAFNLGVMVMRELVDTYGKKIEIIAAGAEWDEAEYGLAGKITNMGLIKSVEEVASVYRSCDIGFSYMLNKHTSYQMLEYTASGVATVINFNEDHKWLYKDGINCLVAEPSPAAMAEKIGLLIKDEPLRKRLVKNATKELGYSWDQQFEAIWNDVRHY